MTRRRFARVAAAAAASTIFLVSFGLATLSAHNHFAGREHARIGEVRRIVLDDGSVMTLNTSTVVHVRYSSEARRIKLSSGEASFEVTHDVARPFIVDAPNASVRAVGTVFAVRTEPNDEVSVTVAEGAVQVEQTTRGASGDGALVEAEHQLRVSPTHEMSAPAVVPTSEIQRHLSWREGRLIFDGETVGEAADEMNRYTETKIVIADDVLAQSAFVGVFRIGDSRTLANTIAAAFDARVSEEDDVLRISRT